MQSLDFLPKLLPSQILPSYFIENFVNFLQRASGKLSAQRGATKGQ